MVLISYSWDGGRRQTKAAAGWHWKSTDWKMRLQMMIKKKRSMWKKIYELEKGFEKKKCWNSSRQQQLAAT